MTITTNDIKLLKSEVLLDTPDGGGSMTGEVIVDGVSNNLFPDISELDRVYGRVSLRKMFTSVQTPTTESYYGSNLIITKLPTDPNVSVNLFSTENWTDRRIDAQDNIESYLASGPRWSGHLLETQLQGQRAIQLSLNNTDMIPSVGNSVLLIQNEGLVTEYFQYVRITKTTSVVQQFPFNNTTVARTIVTVEISDPLDYQFDGISVQQFLTNVKPAAFLRDTRVADAANYYGASRLAVDVATIGAASITVDSIFTTLVPSAQSETPMLDLSPAGQTTTYVESGNTLTVTATTSTITSTNVYLGQAILPGTLTFTMAGQAITDGGGVLKSGGTEIGTIEYNIGLLRFNSSAPSVNTNIVYTFKPAAVPLQVSHSAFIEVTQGNRGFNYVLTLEPTPTPNTLVISYVAQGKVYYLRDNGLGQIKGTDPSFGSGSLNYSTGTALVTLGVLPDSGGIILYQWGDAQSIFNRSSNTVDPLMFEIDLDTQISPSTCSITWSVNGVSKSASDNGAGLFTGDATGILNYGSGKIQLIPTILPNIGSTFVVSVSKGAPLNFTEDVAAGAVPYTYTLSAGAPILHGTVSIRLALIGVASGAVRQVTLVDQYTSGDDGDLVFQGTSTIAGSIDYVTRQVTINPSITGTAAIPVVRPHIYYAGA